MTPAETVKQCAREAGFDLCGVTTAEIIPEAATRYKEWLQKGYHADMHYLENIERRTNPRAVMPNAKSVIMLALNYYSDQCEEADQAKIARYGRGRDYHKVTERTLKLFTLMLKKAFPVETFRYYVDYGPFLERAYAEKAGIGFIGKNGNIITHQFGSWVLLSEVITTMEMEPDAPAVRQCGTCTKCLTGCPTQAIVEDGLIDARKCISFQTIENKSDTIPTPIKEQMSGWAFGCDICQEVCPFNNHVRNKNTLHEELEPRYAGFVTHDPALTSDDLFLEKFQGTPIMRAKRKGIMRNLLHP